MFHRTDRGRTTTVGHVVHFTGTCVGNDKSLPGPKLMGWNVPAVVGEDAVVRRANDASAAGRENFDEWAICDGATGDDVAPFRASGCVVISEDSRMRGATVVKVVDSGIPIFCQNFGITTNAIDRFSCETPRNSDAVHAAAISLDLPPPGSLAVRPELDANLRVVLKVPLDFRTPAASHLVAVRHHGHASVRVVRQYVQREAARRPLRLSLLGRHRQDQAVNLARGNPNQRRVNQVQRRCLDGGRVEFLRHGAGGCPLAAVAPGQALPLSLQCLKLLELPQLVQLCLVQARR